MVIIGFLYLATAMLLVGGNGWSQIVAAVVLAWVSSIGLAQELNNAVLPGTSSHIFLSE